MAQVSRVDPAARDVRSNMDASPCSSHLLPLTLIFFPVKGGRGTRIDPVPLLRPMFHEGKPSRRAPAEADGAGGRPWVHDSAETRPPENGRFPYSAPPRAHMAARCQALPLPLPGGGKASPQTGRCVPSTHLPCPLAQLGRAPGAAGEPGTRPAGRWRCAPASGSKAPEEE